MTWQEVVLENTHLHIVERQDRLQKDKKEGDRKERKRRESERESWSIQKRERSKEKDQRKPAKGRESRK